ncbi:MAG: glycosyltransferase family 39 protein [Kiritimatiellia bacterium]
MALLESIFLRGFRPYAWLVLVALTLYGPSLFFGFVSYDDNVLVRDNVEFLNKPSNVGKAFSSHYFLADSPRGRYYRPLVTLSYMTDTWIGGGRAWLYHATNIVLLVLAASFLLLLLKAMPGGSPGIAFAGALLFAVHPLQAMAVAWIPGRNDTLLACFFFPALLAFFRHRRTGRPAWLFVHLACFALALLTKETAVCIPVLALAWLWFVEGGRDWRKWLSHTPFYVWLAMGLAWFLLRASALGFFAAGNPGTGFSWLAQLRTLTGLLVRYYGKTAIPAHLALVPDPARTPIIYGAVLTVATALAVWRLRPRERGLALFGFFWAALILALSVPFSSPPEVRNLGLLEHRMVVAWAGVGIAWLAIARGAGSWRPGLGAGAAAVAVVLLGGLTRERLPAFLDMRSFWTRAVAESPDSSDAWHNYGCVWLVDRRFDEAEKAFRHALAVEPGRPLSHLNLAYIYSEQKRYAESFEACFQELKNEPYSVKACQSLAVLYGKTGSPDLAREWRRREQELRSISRLP